MATYTVCISRNLSAQVGAPNGKPVGDVFQLVAGNQVTTFNSKQMQKDIFYFKTCDLSDNDFNAVNADISDRDNPKQVSVAGVFSGAEQTSLAERGEKATDLGSTINYASFVRTNKTGPTWSENSSTDQYPKSGTIAATTAQALLKIKGEAGNGYMVVLADDADAPTSAQVKAGQDANGDPVASGFSDSGVLVADTEKTLSASNLSASTDYDVYVVAENGSSEL